MSAPASAAVADTGRPGHRVRVLNPNTSQKVTASVARAMAPAARRSGCEFDFATAPDGPEGIVTQQDYEYAQATVAREVQARREEADAFVVACFSDPGVARARELSGGRPVLGVGEAGLRAALRRGGRVGVVAIADAAIPRHLRYWQQLGLADRVAAERALNLRVDQSGDAAVAWDALQLRDQDGADVLLLGCAGMGDLRAALESATGLPVVDPCVAAVELVGEMLDARAGEAGSGG